VCAATPALVLCPLSLHDALPICGVVRFRFAGGVERRGRVEHVARFRTLTWRWREHLGAGFGSRIGEPSFVTIDLRRVPGGTRVRSEEHTSELQSRENLVCRLLLE